MTLPPERRRQLQELGLRALLKRRFGPAVADAATSARFAGGAAVVVDSTDGPRLAAVFAGRTAGLGPAVDLAAAAGAVQLFFFCERNSGTVARRAAEFSVDTVVVDPDGDVERLEPEPPAEVAPMPAALEPAAARMGAAGLDVEWEHGALLGEWLGLEVARATPDPDAPGGWWFDVGVGKHDREANRMLHPSGAPEAFLDQAVAMVREIRRPAAAPHPANQLAPERWLRSAVLARPDWIGLSDLRTGPPPQERDDLRQRAVAPLWGRDPDGRPVVAVCSAGIDPDLVPAAADARLQAAGWPGFPAGEPHLLVVVPTGDDHPLTRRLAGLLRRPAQVVTVAPGWRNAARPYTA